MLEPEFCGLCGQLAFPSIIGFTDHLYKDVVSTSAVSEVAELWHAVGKYVHCRCLAQNICARTWQDFAWQYRHVQFPMNEVVTDGK